MDEGSGQPFAPIEADADPIEVNGNVIDTTAELLGRAKPRTAARQGTGADGRARKASRSARRRRDRASPLRAGARSKKAAADPGDDNSSMASTDYTAKDITVLEGLEPVRKRPGMYIGGVGSAGLHHLVWEILDNAIDEAMNGYASNIRVTLHADGSSITIEDDGRGIPIDKHPKTKKSALEVIFTVLHAGGKFEHGNYKTAGGLHGVGASVVNALSKELVATVKRDGAQWEMRFKQGKPVGRAQEDRPGARHRHDGLLPPRRRRSSRRSSSIRTSSTSGSRSPATCTRA